MTTKDNAKANVITAQKTEEKRMLDLAEKFCEEVVSSAVSRASEKGLTFVWVQTPWEIVSIKEVVNGYLRTAGGFTNEDITWQGSNLRIGWGE